MHPTFILEKPMPNEASLLPCGQVTK
uniref:Uncharacterized protein n=1 Tax=Anguilla anguilla TaxID=7936 RepID=A0A0E9RZS4_ANGAN